MLTDMPLRHIKKKILGVDCSTNSLAWCLLDKDKLISYGKIDFTGDNILERVKDASIKVKAVKSMLDYDAIAFEAAVFINSPKTASNLAYVYGASMGALMKNKHTAIITVVPMAWQAFINNKPLTKIEKAFIKEINPNKSSAWLKNEERNYRKRRTASWVKKKFGLEISDFDVTDAFGIAYYGGYKVNSGE